MPELEIENSEVYHVNVKDIKQNKDSESLKL